MEVKDFHSIIHDTLKSINNILHHSIILFAPEPCVTGQDELYDVSCMPNTCNKTRFIPI
jgi:hypothetical protein